MKGQTGQLDFRLPGIQRQPPSLGLALTQDLADWQYPQATLLQYVDDLFLCGPTEPVILLATESLLNFLEIEVIKSLKKKPNLLA
jgi:hypothetical protein